MTEEPTGDRERDLTPEERVERIRMANDALRRFFIGGRVMLTIGVNGLESSVRDRVLKAVREFDAFDKDCDPHGEHDFGAVKIDGETYFFKHDYYDRDLLHGSPDPADSQVTSRVMTILRADEY